MLEVLIDNRDGNVWDVSRLVESLQIRSSRFGKAGTADLSLVNALPYASEAYKLQPGNVVRIRKDGANLFYGYVFVVDQSEDEKIKLSLYDQVRYLSNSDTYQFVKQTASQIIQKIIKDSALQAGTIASTKHVIPKLLEENQKLLDIICKALELTMTADRELYVFYDDFGRLTLRNIKDMVTEVVIGEKSLLYGFKARRSIDKQSYNRIKLVRDNKDSGKREVYVEQDSASLARWGRLQYYRKMEDDANEAQILQAASNLLKLYNREERSLSLDALGDVRVRAGSGIYITLPALGIAPSLHLVNECTHQFKGDEHTMALEVAVFDYGTD